MIKLDVFDHMQSKGKVMYFKDFVNGRLKWRSSQDKVILCTDHEGEYTSDEFEDYLKRVGI